eukprot:66001-Chlamydomonas_euryale.AAC.1
MCAEASTRAGTRMVATAAAATTGVTAAMAAMAGGAMAEATVEATEGMAIKWRMRRILWCHGGARGTV